MKTRILSLVSSPMLGLVLLYIVTTLVLSNAETWLFSIAMIPILVWLSDRDLRKFELPDIGTAAFALIAALTIYWTYPTLLMHHVTTGICVCAVFWAIGAIHFRIKGREALGIGDAKLFGAGSILLGPWQVPEMVLFSCIGGIIGHFLSNIGSNSQSEGIPFGPFIAYAVFVLSFLDPIFL